MFRRLDLEEDQYFDVQDVRHRILDLSWEIFPSQARDHLASYPKTTERFREHFQQRGYPEDLIEDQIPLLREEDFLDDERLAREHVRKRCRSKPRGKRKLVAELRGKGVPRDTARSVVDDMVPSEREREMLETYCEQNPDLDAETLARRLDSRGFPGGLIHDAVQQRR